MASSPINSKKAGINNEKLVLNIVRKKNRISQTELCKLTGLRSSTTSYIVSRLREKDLIIEKKGTSKKRGAKPTYIQLNPQGKFIVSVDINPDKIVIGLYDLNCSLQDKFVAPLDTEPAAPEKVTELIQIYTLGLLGKNNLKQSQLLGLGATLSASISQNGTVVLSSPMNWKNVPLKEMLSANFDCPVKIYTTRVRLLAELVKKNNFGSNILYINIANGVGCTAITDGKMLLGSTGKHGELGHIVVDPNGPVCGCGNKGCLEALISGPAIAKKIVSEASYNNSVLADMISDTDKPEEIISKWGQAVKNKDQYALSVLQYISKHFSYATTLAINIYDPSLIIVAGYISLQCYDHLINALKKHMPKSVYSFDSRKIKIVPAKAGSNALINGSAIAVLNDCFV